MYEASASHHRLHGVMALTVPPVLFLKDLIAYDMSSGGRIVVMVISLSKIHLIPKQLFCCLIVCLFVCLCVSLWFCCCLVAWFVALFCFFICLWFCSERRKSCLSTKKCTYTGRLGVPQAATEHQEETEL